MLHWPNFLYQSKMILITKGLLKICGMVNFIHLNIEFWEVSHMAQW